MTRVWDLGVRLFHWLLVLCVALAAGTGFFGLPDGFTVHLVAGTSIAGLVLFRFVWGLTGPTYARFSSFIFSPQTLIAEARALRRGPHRRYLGHNPLGGAMVFALGLVLIAIVMTGTVALGGVIKQGPLAFLITYDTGRAVREVHQVFAFALMGLVALHLVGVVYESLIGKEQLVLAMVNGDKPSRPGDRRSRLCDYRTCGGGDRDGALLTPRFGRADGEARSDLRDRMWFLPFCLSSEHGHGEILGWRALGHIQSFWQDARAQR
jgi:cytochrome b